ncbi:hypothetical protein Vadar_033867 [Vaccinium darrowii]|uniref:Uncharacterized protein n=1 Tax=Vaccinium darrowii TaxID=229202 RepID=A0ACB7YJY9_9ERIC|nr:hypothetical protein Vadar_033867 [Vaccinium darrowii]
MGSRPSKGDFLMNISQSDSNHSIGYLHKLLCNDVTSMDQKLNEARWWCCINDDYDAIVSRAPIFSNEEVIGGQSAGRGGVAEPEAREVRGGDEREPVFGHAFKSKHRLTGARTRISNRTSLLWAIAVADDENDILMLLRHSYVDMLLRS